MAESKNKITTGAERARVVGRKVGEMISFPLKVLQPLIRFLKHEEKRLKKVEKNLENEDPFNNTGRVDDNAVDTDAVEQVEHERVSATKAAINKSLVSVRKTMTRIKLGRYGICEECHKMIDTDRLAIDLTAEYCVKCAAKIEAKKK